VKNQDTSQGIACLKKYLSHEIYNNRGIRDDLTITIALIIITKLAVKDYVRENLTISREM